MSTRLPSKRLNYLSNRELLIEIHKSKKTFCSFLDEQYEEYDVIVQKKEEINKQLLERAKQEKAELLSKIKKQELKDSNVKNITDEDFTVDASSINDEDVVIRCMTFEHIPFDDTKTKTPKSESDKHIRLNFPPFKHFIVEGWNDKEPILKEVGKSHWEGGLSNGFFNQEHGYITERLAHMFMTLAQRYSQRGNWRNYCVDAETEALTKRGWLSEEQICENDEILSFNEGQLKWSKIKSIFRNEYDGKMFHLTVSGMDALVTPRHKFITDQGLKKVEYLIEKNKIILTGEPVENNNKIFDDKFVELVGWFITKGNIFNPSDRNYSRITIAQNKGIYSDRILECISSLNYKCGQTHRLNENKTTTIIFTLPKELCEKLLSVTENKSLSMDFILSLTQEQKKLLIETMVDADGWRTKKHKRYCQKDKNHVDSFLALCTLAGFRTTCKKREIISFGKDKNIYQINIFSGKHKVSRVENINFHGGKRRHILVGKGKKAHPNEPTIEYKGKIWCPETEYGSFMARRNGTIYLTGNTYIDEMRNSAILQLVSIGLRFDESRSQNPFAYYTAAITNSFTRVLNVEKKNQNIRDEILISQGANPSYTKQVENEISSKDSSNF